MTDDRTAAGIAPRTRPDRNDRRGVAPDGRRTTDRPPLSIEELVAHYHAENLRLTGDLAVARAALTLARADLRTAQDELALTRALPAIAALRAWPFADPGPPPTFEREEIAGPDVPAEPTPPAAAVVPSDAPPRRVVIGALTIDLEARRVRLGDARVPLTDLEYRLLEALAVKPGHYLSMRAIMGRVWGEEFVDRPRYCKEQIYRLRKKLGDDPKRPTYIESRPGGGYRLRPAIVVPAAAHRA